MVACKSTAEEVSFGFRPQTEKLVPHHMIDSGRERASALVTLHPLCLSSEAVLPFALVDFDEVRRNQD